MGKWSQIRLVLKATSATCAVGAGIAALVGALPLAGILTLIATHAGAVAVELPRDQWSPEKRAAMSEEMKAVTPKTDPTESETPTDLPPKKP